MPLAGGIRTRLVIDYATGEQLRELLVHAMAQAGNRKLMTAAGSSKTSGAPPRWGSSAARPSAANHTWDWTWPSASRPARRPWAPIGSRSGAPRSCIWRKIPCPSYGNAWRLWPTIGACRSPGSTCTSSPLPATRPRREQCQRRGRLAVGVAASAAKSGPRRRPGTSHPQVDPTGHARRPGPPRLDRSARLRRFQSLSASPERSKAGRG